MNRARLVAPLLLLLLAACAHGPALAPMALPALQRAFNADAASPRVVALLSPT